MMELPTDELLDYLVSDDYLDAQEQQDRTSNPWRPVPVQPTGICIPMTSVLTGVAALDELLKAAVTPARRRRWWWPW